MESCYVFFEVGDKVFNFMQMSFAFKALIILHSDQLTASLNNPQINKDSPEFIYVLVDVTDELIDLLIIMG
jgi:hypothetical protein